MCQDLGLSPSSLGDQSSVASLIVSSWCDGYDYMAISKHCTKLLKHYGACAGHPAGARDVRDIKYGPWAGGTHGSVMERTQNQIDIYR